MFDRMFWRHFAEAMGSHEKPAEMKYLSKQWKIKQNAIPTVNDE